MHPTAAALIRSLDLDPHPEGGHYRRTYAAARRVTDNAQARPALTAIRFGLSAGDCSAWHRVDAEESWHWQQGDALELLIYDESNRHLQRLILDAAERGDPM
ncbi:Hypothetical Protein PD5205_01271 [Xanthomonas fragariae]|uniref:DUF985 domain-containing protein n=1 Tax=Xanthomonas fragariae TaxID=48664 RepID=A0A1Y6HME1_9XANT|nr:hypothetical protein O1K_14515 [Xanthomonas fragariae LMG 25863]SMQ94654.1 Hypothetical Protein NBC2815_01305 [Xanthomonas fragariae]SMQ99963.1 hypothetical protein PD885_02734 [Xanthomonas fragariae]SMR02583.1 Hypothetical Protein PD5205_01271 [Xanthomonas fragariae]